MQPVSTQRSPQCINPERAARVHKDSIVAAETPCKEDSSQVSSSQAHILNALRLMGCKEHENSVQRLRPNIDARCHVLHVTETDIQATAMKSIKSLTRQSIAGPATDEIEIDDKDHVPSVATSIDIGVEKLEYVFTMRSLVLKHDIATMYKVYSEKYKDAMPGKPPIGRTLFYSIAKTSSKVRSRSNIAVVDKIIDVLAPLSNVDHILHDELYGLHSDVYTFLSYGYAVHVRDGVKVPEDHAEQCHLPHEQEDQLFKTYQEL
eukprot:Em0014g400a